MLWFQGAIPAAIASAKRSGAVFVVFVAGDDEQSTQMAASWEDEKVTEASSDSFVAIKIDTKSEACLQFSQIYPVVCVPSSFFIGDSGIPLEVIAGSVSADELVTRIHKVRQMHSLKGETSVANGSPSESSVSTPSTSLEPNNTSENSQSRNVEPCEIPPTSDTKSDSATGGESSGHASPSQEPGGCSNQRPPEDLTVRVERLTKKLEERREEKRKEEEQREIKKEIERRKTGKEMLDYKRKQEEELTKRMLEERNREKAEDRAARERIKQQIALDRAERAARFAKTKEEVEAAKAAALLAKQAEMEVKRDSSARERSTIARIQFRLPDGSSFTNQFPSDAPLEEARQFAAQTVGNTYGNFSLATMFPRREFTKEDYKKKLLDLELAPSASVVLLPAGRPTTSMVHSSSGDFWTLLGTVLYPFLAIWRLISNFLFSNPPAQTSVRAAASEPSNLASSSNSEKREPVRKRVLEKRGEDFKKEGKIYRLRTQDDGEDENNTWNGNSTQQM
ncbi:UBX domain-containing protein 4 isoform X1 [Panthera pardus]|uniref:UBX domain-containing protein 4 n=4 Tax=Felidae TaxID=9681 RepID=A0A6J1Z2V4_ACIJB|nr:UBX domain-containing protein 4 isoform X1 [Panthera pardus]XP_026911691.1 UBX domain-containing protein 4 [Acinonyx jubatus]XP_030183788.1 UBX domain-containing protein 4 [Lynx canadensis]XP_042804520.1 UBX domain-containing protein 4 [Panthera leo]XP_042850298.1 UBX domain-containing protein 4 [Panthera tigris]XP_043429255.1 UBX domain-containing protein 4 [Prionailurus bengalensis]XP_045335620.1 UBX domain-containing protein 4 [Leopardus geoffroyi]XP_049471642.1 UBX domain-containing p